ncbi:MAG TPA: hypothetical protein PKD12_08140 [Nitrospira sp.]|nr:hypothetical protein [Nitrospira sp.]
MPTVKNKLASVKNHVIRNRGRYGFATGLIAGSYVTAVTMEWNALLSEIDPSDVANAIAE